MKEIGINIEFFKEDLIQAIDSGVYQISIQKNNKSRALYIGQSVFVLVRCAFHLYKLKKEPTYFGFTEEIIKDSNITLKFELLEKVEDTSLRKKREGELIKIIKPLVQRYSSDRVKHVEDRVLAIREFLNMN